MFDWKKNITDILLTIIKFINRTGHIKNISKKENWWNKKIQIPTWIIGIFLYIVLVVIFVYEFGISYEMFIGINFFVFICMFLSIYFLGQYKKEIIEDDDAISLIGLVLVIFIFLIIIIRNSGITYFLLTPLPACSMILNIFFGPLVAFMLSLILIIIMLMVYNYNFSVFFIMLFNCLFAIYGTRSVFSRKDIARAGIILGPFNILLIFMLKVFFLINFKDLFNFFILGFVNGIGSAIITIGFLPYMESFFSIATNIKLLELSDFMQPILKKMLFEIPGTYNHSIVVGNLGEAAAREIEANPLLTRAAAYYHDIGKINNAQYFIENNPDFVINKHDNLTPQMSAMILISHVKYGISIAKKMKLPKQIIDIIEQHHGNTLIAFFYDKAKKLYGEKNVDEKLYRYPYKKPQTKEAVIIMITDSIEAAMHTQTDFSKKNIKNVVNNIIQHKMADSQFEESNITLSDLKKISDSCVETLMGIYHHRIEYPNL
ncbi:MAG: HDIG domain-containing protein [Elusimicrobiota bacterium]|jgi:putative nucleotidyltransferase with HDIG domain|nr:HDIG domain-containing protein [Elusimicrobiota bacterium]